jgi:hypothetical protein
MKIKKIIIGLTFSIVGVAVLFGASFFAYGLFVSSVFTSGDLPHKSDEELIANFQARHTEFNRLLEMVMSDRGLHRVDDNWTDPKDPQTIGISRERIEEYRDLFARLEIPRGFSANQEVGVVEFISSSQGLSVSGSSKSYAYLKNPPANVVDNIDRYRVEGKGSYPIYRHIEGNWYLVFDAD